MKESETLAGNRECGPLCRVATGGPSLKDHAAIQKAAQDMATRSWLRVRPRSCVPRSADVEVMKMLLAKGADPRLNKDGLMALMLVAREGWSDHVKGAGAEALEAVKLCKEVGLDVNLATDKGDR